MWEFGDGQGVFFSRTMSVSQFTASRTVIAAWLGGLAKHKQLCDTQETTENPV